MASEIRVNQIQNRSGLGTVTFNDAGVSIAGVTTVGILSATGNSVFSGDLNVSGTISGNVSASGVSTFSSGIVVAAGSTAAPSISPIGDSNTGIFFPSPDTVAIGEGGVEALRINSSGRLVTSGNVGIRTTEDGTFGGFAQPNLYIKQTATDWTGGIHIESTSDQSVGTISMNSSGFEFGQSYRSSGSYKDINFYTSGVKRATIDTSGRVTMPYQPCFSVYRTTNQNIAHNTATKIQFNTENFDVGSNFDSSTNFRFTAPVAGKYAFMGVIYIYSVYYAELSIYKNGAEFKRYSGAVGSGGNDNPNGRTYAGVVDLAVNDYVEIYALMSRTGDSATQSIYGGLLRETSFDGYLIG